MKKEKTILEYCSVCDEELEMPIIQRDSSNPHLVWVRCPKCNETKPVDFYQAAEELREGEEEFEEEFEEAEEEIKPVVPPPAPTRKKKPKKKAKEEEIKPEEIKINPENAREYNPQETFQPGETIFHPKWNDYGVVLRRRRSGGGREIIEVHFEKLGEKKLIVNMKTAGSS